MKREKISLELLLLSDGNPRLEPSFGEDEAINNMVADQNNKLVELASDIVVHGLNPLDTVGVYPSETYRGFYEIGEGNRRMCALKLLAAPERIQHINAALFSKFAALLLFLELMVLVRLLCYICWEMLCRHQQVTVTG